MSQDNSRWTTEENMKESQRYKWILPAAGIVLILAVLWLYIYNQNTSMVKNVEQVTNQMAEYIAGSIAKEVDNGLSSIKLSAISVAQSMTSDTIKDPGSTIDPVTEESPFDAIEYIRSDGMNVMNAGEPFDASDRVYYIEGIKGNTGIWNNYHPKTSKDTLINFYTPLVYRGRPAGVITGYIEANSQIAPLFDENIYGHPIQGLLIDENNMVICTNTTEEYIYDYSLDMYMDSYGARAEQKLAAMSVIEQAAESAISSRDPIEKGRFCVVKVPKTDWKVLIIVPATSFGAIVFDSIREALNMVITVSLILCSYAALILLSNIRKRRAMALINSELEEKNQKAMADVKEMHDIIVSAHMGTWRIELTEGRGPRMYAGEMMRKIMGISDRDMTPEETYDFWYGRILPDSLDSVIKSVQRMKDGYFDENTYLWNNPTMGERYVRCGGSAQCIDGGYMLSGYHYDVDDTVREEQATLVMMQESLNEKNDYYKTLDSLSGIFYSMHVIDLINDTVEEFNADSKVREFVNRRQGAADMMEKVMTASTVDEYRKDALEFTDLTTLSERMKGEKIISRQFIGVNTGWFQASFIAMDTDEEGRATKVIYTTRVIDEMKKQEEKLLKKSQTDELTGLLNRRACEEAIYAHDDRPATEEFTYVSLDVNGLKIVNDTLGHAAGDELIIGASQCMKKCLGAYGKVYRTGGDEFVAFLICGPDKMQEICADFDETILNWKGNLIDELSVSYGWIHKGEEPDMTIRQLGVIADQRMYEAKAAHYRKMGVDRRGQQDAHKALCNLYTKILKINVTDDTYRIIDMDFDEQSEEKGFAADKISAWLEGFGRSGQVHPDDLEEYLRNTDLKYIRDYFAGNKTSLHLIYKRKYGDEFKQVMMELIPANDYSDDNKSLFLYVKDIDK